MTATAIDLFAGAGGSSEGARMAGVRVLWAANHWPLAVKIHEQNHPETQHLCQDLHQADFHTVPQADIMLASPSCVGHSEAASGGGRYLRRGSLPKHDADRSTAWAAVSCLEATRMDLGIVENVPRFRKWVLYPAWRAALEALGYSIAEHVFNAADYGVPQRRERLFITLTRGKTPLILQPEKLAHVAIRDALDLTEGVWRSTTSLPPKARARVERSRIRHPRGPFLTHYVSDDMGHSVDGPMRTLTTKHQWAIVKSSRKGDVIRMFSSREYARGQTFPDDYTFTGKVADDCRLIGNAVPPKLMCALLQSALKAA